jgi:LmbE family N-acetylglucosaminyl deacetylase
VTAPLPPALFIAAHPDDELLAMGVALAEHVAVGREVHLLWLTDGGTTSARNALNGTTTSSWWGILHNPAAEGYAPLSEADCAAARIREGVNAVNLLATPGTVTIHQAHLQDGAYTQGQVEAAVLTVADLIAPTSAVHLKTHSWLVDNHPDHLAAGNAVKHLAATLPARFAFPRYYVLSTYFADPRLAQVSDTFDNPTDAGISQRVRNACRAYGAWAPAQGLFAVGMHSVSGLFDTLTANPRSLVHP